MHADAPEQLEDDGPPLPRRSRPPPRLLPREDRAPPRPPSPTRTAEMMNFVHENAEFEGLSEERKLEGVRFSKLEEFLAVQIGARHSCRTLPLTMALWLTLVLLVFSHGQANLSYQSAAFIDNTIQAGVAPGAGTQGQDLTLDSILEHEDVMKWIELVLTPVLVIDGLRSSMAVDNQQLIGYLRLRQTRGDGPVPCDHLSSSLRSYYTQDCHPLKGTGLYYGDGNVSTYEFAWTPTADDNYDTWIQIGRGMDSVEKHFRSLERSNWIDLSSNTLAAEAVILAPENHVYSHLRIAFTFNREGLIAREMRVKPLRGDVYPNWGSIMLNLAWVLVLLALLWEMGSKLADEHSKGLLKLHVTDIFVWLDWVVFSWGVLLGVLFYFVLVIKLNDMFDLIADLGDPPEFSSYEAPASRAVEITIAELDYFDSNAQILDSMDLLGSAIMYHRLCTFWYSLLLVLRYLRGFIGTPRMAVMMQSMLAFSVPYFHYLVVFFLVFGTYALSGFFIFGERVVGWSTFGQSISSLFQVMFGHINYHELHDIAPITTACWFSSFVVLVMQLLLGVLTAAILHTYIEVRSRLGEPGDSFVKQANDYLGDAFWRRSYEGSLKSTPYDELLKILDEDTDPVRLRNLARLRRDRRLRNREDVAAAADDPQVDIQFLVDRGCDPAAARRLLEKVAAWSSEIGTTTLPVNRMILLVARHLGWVQAETEAVRGKLRSTVHHATSGVERLDLKHAKCNAMVCRIRKAQEMPHGWEELRDNTGARYLRHRESGLTSWHLPRNMF